MMKVVSSPLFIRSFRELPIPNFKDLKCAPGRSDQAILVQKENLLLYFAALD